MNKAKPGKPVQALTNQLTGHIARGQPESDRFTRPSMIRMRQSCEPHAGDEIILALPRQLPWTLNLIILNQSKRFDLKRRKDRAKAKLEGLSA